MQWVRRIFSVVVILLAIGIVYLAFWPVAVDPVAWDAPKAPALEGDYEPNAYLAEVEQLAEGFGIGPEDIEVHDGAIFTGYEDGRIVAIDAETDEVTELTNTGGRPLGVDFDQFGHLIIADAVKGLLSLKDARNYKDWADDHTETLEVLASSHGGVPFGFTDDVVVAPDGTIYFTDASHKFGAGESVPDIVENGPNGRLLAWNPETYAVELVIDDLHFPNGVAVSPDGTFLLMNETARYRVYKVWLIEEKKHQYAILMDNLPGFPDNITSNGEGLYWVALFAPRNPLLDGLSHYPWARKVLMRLPEAFRPQPERYSFALGINGEGEIVHNLQDPGGAYAPITCVTEIDETLYLGSLTEPAVGRIAAPRVQSD